VPLNLTSREAFRSRRRAPVPKGCPSPRQARVAKGKRDGREKDAGTSAQVMGLCVGSGGGGGKEI